MGVVHLGGRGAPWLQSSFAKLSRLDLNSSCGLDRPQNCNPPSSASQGIVPLDLASWLFIKTQTPLSPAVTGTFVGTQGGDRWQKTFFLGSSPGGEKVDRTESLNGEMPPAFPTSSAVTVRASNQRQGVWGLLTFRWLAISRGQEL